MDDAVKTNAKVSHGGAAGAVVAQVAKNIGDLRDRHQAPPTPMLVVDSETSDSDCGDSDAEGEGVYVIDHRELLARQPAPAKRSCCRNYRTLTIAVAGVLGVGYFSNGFGLLRSTTPDLDLLEPLPDIDELPAGASIEETLKTINEVLKGRRGYAGASLKGARDAVADKLRRYSCKTVSWDDVSRSEYTSSGGGSWLSAGGPNISDSYLVSKDEGKRLFTVRPENWNEKLATVSADGLAMCVQNADMMGGALLKQKSEILGAATGDGGGSDSIAG